MNDRFELCILIDGPDEICVCEKLFSRANDLDKSGISSVLHVFHSVDCANTAGQFINALKRDCCLAGFRNRTGINEIRERGSCGILVRRMRSDCDRRAFEWP